MEQQVTSSFLLGILGGGQLGKMLALQAANWDISVHCLDANEKAPARLVCKGFQKGSITNYDDVMQFGKEMDLITVESDNVNVDALEALEKMGKQVSPSSSTLRIIQDKGLQRQFCEKHSIPIPKYKVYNNKKDLVQDDSISYPCIVKTRKEGYDGKGVFLLENPSDLPELPDTPLLYEEKVDIQKEFAAIVIRNEKGEVEVYPLIELFMKPSAYMVDYLVSPTKIDADIEQKAQQIAKNLAEALKIEGVLAVELFLTKTGHILVNECSPRPHNSGHHTIEASLTSQYENHLRGILDLPLGKGTSTMHAAMINLLGDPQSKGPVQYQGLSSCLSISGTSIHIYGKSETSPFRKMGHITVLHSEYPKLIENVHAVKDAVKVSST